VSDSIRPFYADWAGYNRRVTEALRGRPAEDLGLQVPGSDHWPIWAIAGHMAGTRVYWLCEVLGEPGAELESALTSTWRIVEGCLERWTPSMLGEAASRQRGETRQIHTRQSILLRLIHHEAYHVGEISLTLGAHGRAPIDLWPRTDWAADAPRALREG
jgi:uncharacterized damage-inducible protein DinB